MRIKISALLLQLGAKLIALQKEQHDFNHTGEASVKLTSAIDQTIEAINLCKRLRDMLPAIETDFGYILDARTTMGLDGE